MIMLNDITSAEDIDVLVENFYDKLLHHPEMKNFFSGIDLVHHLPRIKHFWRFVLLDEPGYTTNVFEKHMHLQADKKHFDLWVQLFSQTVDEHFSGERANEAKLRAQTIGFTFAHKMDQIRKSS
ncbi:MAG: hypothetical protein RLZZ262_1237 [Bacteroidota bacterium]|jgi:hemoglobin